MKQSEKSTTDFIYSPAKNNFHENKNMIQFKSYAKINLGLQVLEKRNDGFHNINTIFARISLADDLEINEISSEEIIIESNPSFAFPMKNNLIFKAAEKLREKENISTGAKIRINKNIPMGAGLGGGSSNCAYTLKNLRKFWNLKENYNRDLIISQTLGSDVPFFLKDGLAIGKSRGEKLEYFDIKLPWTILIVNPNIHISTPSAFAQLNRNSKPRTSLNLKSILIKSLQNPSLLREYMINDFEKIIFKTHPEIAQIKSDLYSEGAFFALMSGSGSTLFGLFENEKIAEEARNKFPDYFTHISHFI
jgi:4-diphosphocytidyl-2-C-methyl-D-erythritol kinase